MTTTATTALISPDRLPHRAMREGELFLKRRTFAVERAAVLRLQALYRAAFNDIRAVMLDSAGQGTTWRAPVEQYAAQRVGYLKRDVLATVEGAAKAALVGNYYGRLWLLDMATPEDVRINTPLLMPPDTLQEDYYDSLIRDLLGKQWRAQYDVELDDLTLGIRRAIGTGLQNGEGMDAIQRRVRDSMGVPTDRRKGRVGSAERRGYRANFNRVQAMTRTVVQTVANNGTIAAYRANSDILSGAEWLTANDEAVCPICSGLNGKVFPLKSNFRPPAHYSCRCTIIPVIKADALDDSGKAPRVPFKAWASGWGMERELADFLG